MIPELVTVGGLTVDNVIAADGTVGLGKAGGNGAYSAVGARIWSRSVGLVSCAVASYPRPTIEQLERHGIDLGGVVWSAVNLAACSWFIYDQTGHRTEGLSSPPEALAEAGFPGDKLTPEQVRRWLAILSERVAPEEIGYSEFRTLNPLTPTQIPAEWSGARGVHLAPSRLDVMLSMLAHFKRRRITVTADPGWQLAALSLDEIAPLLRGVDAFLPSEVELRALVPGANVADALRIVADYCPGSLAVKMGPDGCLVWDRAHQDAIHVPPQRAATLDPTGAGDSFSGGFLAGLVETGDAITAARFGALSAAQIVTCFGADGALPPDQSAARAALMKDPETCP